MAGCAFAATSKTVPCLDTRLTILPPYASVSRVFNEDMQWIYPAIAKHAPALDFGVAILYFLHALGDACDVLAWLSWTTEELA